VFRMISCTPYSSLMKPGEAGSAGPQGEALALYLDHSCVCWERCLREGEQPLPALPSEKGGLDYSIDMTVTRTAPVRSHPGEERLNMVQT